MRFVIIDPKTRTITSEDCETIIEAQAIAGLGNVDHGVLGVEFLGAGDFDLGDSRPFLYHDHEHVAVRFQPYVLEETGRVERFYRRGDAILVDGVANLDRQIREHRAGFSALNALYADILDLKRFESFGGMADKAR